MSSFPSAIYVPLVAHDNIETKLTVPMLVTDNVAIVASTAGWAANMIAYICEATTGTGTSTTCTSFEVMLVTSVSGSNVLNVSRGFGGTSAIAHAAGKVVSNAVTAAYNKTVNDELLAVEQALGVNLANVATLSGVNAFTGTVNARGAAHTSPFTTGLISAKPSTCVPGDVYFATDAPAGQNLYLCTATNVWTQIVMNSAAGTSPTWNAGRTPSYALQIANVNAYPFSTLNPTQFGANAIVGAINIPSTAVVDGGSGLLGLATTSSTTAAAVGISAYANMLAPGTRAWGGNFAVSNQLVPGGTTGVHATSLIGLELDVNVVSGNADGVIGLQVIGLGSTVQPPNARAVEIAPLGNGTIGAPKWGAGISFFTGSSLVALDVFPSDQGNSQGSQKFQLWSVNSSGVAAQSYINTQPDGTLALTGGNGSPAAGVLLSDGAGNPLLNLQPTSIYLRPLSVYADNATATAAGLAPGRLYRTSTGVVMQVY